MERIEKIKAGMFWKLRSFLPLWGIMGALCSCMEVREMPLVLPDPDSDPEIILSISIPGIETKVTRALTEATESELQTVDILVFGKSSGNQEETYLYRTHATDLQKSDNSSIFKIKTYLLQSEEGTEHRLVILANLREEIERTELDDDFTNNMTKEEVLSRITFRTDTLWKTGTNDYRPLPMWGESASTYPVTSTLTGQQVGDISLVRSVARIDVGICLDNHTELPGDLPENKLELTDVYIYYAMDRGRAVPLERCYDPDEGEAGAVTEPSIPGNASLLETALHYEVSSDGQLLREIYLAEADNTKALTSENQCPVSLVVGGYFTADREETENKTEKSYYRIDFYDTSGSQPELLNLLRNHRYRVNIVEVSGVGLSTKELAIQQPPMNIISKVEVSEEGMVKDIVYDGRYYLGVNTSRFELSSESWPETETSDENLLIVSTNYPEGWTRTGITDEQGNPVTWLRTDSTGGTKQTPVRLILDPNETATARTGYIHLRAGKLEHTITVEQNTESRLRLSIRRPDQTEIPDNDTISFESGIKKSTILARTLILDWSPRDAEVEITLENTEKPFTFGSSGDNLSQMQSLTGGNQVLMIQPPVMIPEEYQNDPMLVKETKVTFTVKGKDADESRTIILKQEKRGIAAITQKYYPLDGKIHSFLVQSNTQWEASLTPGTDHLLSSISSGSDGQEVLFKTKQFTEGSETKTATVTLKSDYFEDVQIPLNCIPCKEVDFNNCYIVKPKTNGTPIQIPVGRANQHNPQAIGDSDLLTAELLWTDNSNGIAESSNIEWINATGIGKTGSILVIPGKQEGNAVVAVKVNDEIKWSWHIWVTNYDPVSDHTLNGNNFMDRNLGAMTNSINNVNSLGTMYQWGRKDPFPGAKEIFSSAPQPIYKATSDNTTITIEVVNNINNLNNSIRNPMVFYINGSSPLGDWYTNSNSRSDQNDTLWGSGSTKTIYDPCPKGWRVPSYDRDTSPWTGFTSDNFPFSENDRGATFNNTSFYPAAGKRDDMRVGNTGDIIANVGGGGYYWAASTPEGANHAFEAYYLRFNVDQLAPIFQANRGHGFSVRCVQE